MCGLAGLVLLPGAMVDPPLEPQVRAMIAPLAHRGPDGDGVWVDAAAGIGLGHRRLSILDLSPAGSQPMASGSGRFVIAYNGEVFNHAELRRELEAAGARFRGHSDTEVILAACEHWGLDATLPRLIGMFALALWDRTGRSLTLVRDRMGVKPLYWGRVGTAIAFGSKLKALRALPEWRGEIDRDALTAYLRYCYVPAPHSVYRGIRKLEPGCLVTVAADGSLSERRYWDTQALLAGSNRRPAGLSDAEATDRLDALLRDAVARRMVADVPVGAFLSGGIDSSVVVAQMQAASDRPVHTFSIGFDEAEYNEADHAAAVARHLGTHHTELIVTPAEAREVIPELPRWYDEPFGDSSQMAYPSASGATISGAWMARMP